MWFSLRKAVCFSQLSLSFLPPSSSIFLQFQLKLSKEVLLDCLSFPRCYLFSEFFQRFLLAFGCSLLVCCIIPLLILSFLLARDSRTRDFMSCIFFFLISCIFMSSICTGSQFFISQIFLMPETPPSQYIPQYLSSLSQHKWFPNKWCCLVETDKKVWIFLCLDIIKLYILM